MMRIGFNYCNTSFGANISKPPGGKPGERVILTKGCSTVKEIQRSLVTKPTEAKGKGSRK